MKDITGQKFGRLTAQWPAGIKRRVVKWLCSCECARMVVVEGRSLLSGNTKSCGCLHRETSRRTGLKNTWSKKHGRSATTEYWMWYGAKRRAKRDGVIFNLSIEDLQIPEYCPILGIRLQRGVGSSVDSSPTCDKIDPRLGYTRENIKVISQRANRIKGDGTAEEHERIAQYIKGNR